MEKTTKATKEMQKLIVTRVPESLAILIERQAREELMPTAAYVRRLLLHAASDGGPALGACER